MAIELVIAENTIALRENTEALNRFMSQSFANGQAPAPAPAKATKAPKSEAAPAAEPTPPSSPAPEATAAPAAEPTSEAQSPTEVPYQDIKNGVLSLVKAGRREAALYILGKYGAKTGTDLTVDQYPAVLADLKAALGE